MDTKKEKLLKKTFDAYIALMLYDFPLDRISEIIADNVTGYGTTVDERVLEINRLKKIVIDQREQGTGLEMHINMSPVTRRISPDEDTAIFMDEFEISMVVDGANNMIPLRLTSVFEFNENAWKLVHLHGSKAVETEGDTWHLDEWKKKNEELQKLVDQKTADLERKNRELKIETALERVRTVAMSMQKPDDLLDVCQIISAQLVMLKVSNIRNVQVAIIDESKKLYSNYQFFTPYSKKVFEETAYENNPASLAMVKEMRKSVNSFFIGSIMGKDLAEFREWRNTYNQFPDPLLDKSSTVYYYFYSIGKGGLGLTTYQKISDENLKIFKRFHKVFTLAYRRFKDIQHALEQAREAQIEAALERVRARAMAMHKSEQLAETAKVLFEQFNLLGKIPDRMSIGIINEETRNFELWVTDQKGETLDHPFLFRLDETTSVAKIYKAWKKKKDAIVVDLTGQELKDWLQFVKKEVNLPINSANIKGRRVQQAAFFSHGFLLLTSHEPVAEEIMKLLVRFAGVFDLTYTRFLDLKNAEAQAREAEIQLALERVRARTMAMHRSDELKNVIQLVYEQFVQLNIFIEHTGFIIDYKASDDMYIWLADRHEIPTEVTIPYFDCAHWNSFKEAKENGMDFFANLLSFEEKNSFYQDLFKLIPGLPEKVLEYYFSSPGLAISTVLLDNVGLYIENFSGIPYTDEENNTLMRFGKVFQQTYTRFNDLKHAEAQAREAQIEAALEKVRSRSIGMQKSEELKEVIQVIHDQLIHLNFKIDAAGFTMDYFQNNDWNIWIANKEQSLPTQIYIPYIDHPQFNYYKGAKEKSLDFFANTLSFEDKNSIFSYMFDFMGDYSQAEKDQVLNAPGLAISQAFLKNITLWIYNLDGNPYSKEDNAILMRFANVFEQTYVRFNDLQKAEAQAREAQIEAALERVRSKTMAMHNSDDMADTVVTLFEEVLKLGLDNDIRCGIGILEGTKRMETRSATLHPKGGVDLKIGMLDMTIHPLLKRIKNGWERGETHYVDQMSGKDVVKYYTALNNEPDYPFLRDLNTLPKIEYHNSFSFPEGILFAFSPNPMSDEAAMVLDRFANVFGQTYRRFRDLQKAEEQARESQIEAALERVRSKAMAMHSSEDLGLTVDTFFAELKGLNVSPHRCGLGIIDKETKIVNVQAIDTNGSKSIKKVVGNLKLSGHPVLDKIFENWELQKEYFPVLKGKEIMEYYRVMNPQVKFHEFADDEVQYGYYFYFKEGGVYAWTDSELPERDLQIFRRYSSVLSLTYRRYLDLKEAEAQAREAKIETALEKVRGQSMAMHKSEQLPETAKVLFEQFKSLGKIPDRIGIVVIKEEVKEVELWATDQIGSQLKDKFRGSLEGASSMVKIHKAWKEGKESIVLDLTGKELIDWMRYTRDEMKLVVDDTNMKGRRVQQAAFFSHGFLIFTSNEPVADDIMKLLVRFAKVFDQAYIRFLDLQKAEAQAKEAIKQASLDRVRGQIASMRSTEDLQRITPLIWRELETLEVPFNRCGVFIVDEPASLVKVYLTTPDGKPLGVLNLPIDINELTRKTVNNWRKKTVYIQHWNKNDFIAWMQSMIELGQVKSEKEYQGNVAPPESLDLNFIPFTQGMLYVGNNKPLSADKIDLVKSLAKAFSVAYARYEDFKQLEEAKNEIENTYNDLKATQNQLVHAEKMASLGELTAGIAHEIQNPLNFVNNFSEVSADLIEELNEEIIKGDTEEVKAIAVDLLQNLEKINHHGKRASNIVKSMLEHSRAGSGEKQSTDLNALTDEYLRLAYHGLRAKDKSFNADFKLKSDPNLPNVNVVPQDIGRVLLNLINNAFYAVFEKQKLNIEGFKPEVIVITRKLDDKIEIRVKDNGYGIPDTVKDKIFQPFFTTKPTGQGTGLGLSMSYDIITKGHSGELTVNTKTADGTEFIIQLPV